MEETGWKLVHGDVFRTPNNNRLFASIIGSGVQIFCMMAITIFFAMLGMSFNFLRIVFQASKETIFHITFKMLIFWRLEVGGLVGRVRLNKFTGICWKFIGEVHWGVGSGYVWSSLRIFRESVGGPLGFIGKSAFWIDFGV